MLKVAGLMAEASFIQKRIEALKVEQELSNAQARVYGTLVSNTAILFKNLFITKKPLLREIILPGVPVMLEIVAL